MSERFALRNRVRCLRSAALAVFALALTIAVTTESAWAGEAAGATGASLTIDAAMLTSAQCHVDDVKDKGTSSIFGSSEP